MLYYASMKSNKDVKRLIYDRLRRIVDKHALVDERPFSLSDSVKLSPREVRTIEFLGQSGTVNVTNVATHFHFTKSAASQLVNRLVKRGLVDKELSPHSDKEFRLTLSSWGEEARRLIADMDRQRLKMFLEMIDEFSEEEMAAAADV
ncbi:MAG: MarR family transcriptional regulator, partial [Pseudodesulfovibrio sp.]